MFDKVGLIEALIEEYSAQSEGNVHLGRVTNAARGMKGVFVDLEGGTGYYPGEDVKQGGIYLFTIIRDGKDGKKPLLSRDLSLRGEKMVLLPLGQKTNFSRKLKGIQKKRLSLIPEIKGVLFRTDAAAFSDEEIISEYNSLLSRRDELLRREKIALRPVHVYSPGFSETNASLDEMINLDSTILSHMESEIVTGEGIKLIIEGTSIGYVADVNSYKYSGSDVNELALERLGREISIRNLSGIILVDLLNEDDMDALLKTAIKILKGDRRIRITGISSSGILEIVRSRKGQSLFEVDHKKLISEMIETRCRHLENHTSGKLVIEVNTAFQGIHEMLPERYVKYSEKVDRFSIKTI